MCDGEDPRGAVSVTFAVVGEPVSKERPRVVAGRTFTPAKTKNAEAEVAFTFMRWARGWKLDGSFKVHCEFHCGTARRRDVDNMLKLVLDALNGVAYDDDAQVVEVSAVKVLRSASPRTIVTIERL